MSVVEEAMERLILGVSSRRHVLTPEERRRVAYHEAGHALVALALPGARVPHKLSVIPRGRALGFMWDAGEDDRAIHARSDLVDQLAMLLAGRTAEQLVFREPSSGAADDLERASAMARRMVCELGMSDALGGVSYPDAARPDQPSYSQEELRAIGVEVRRLIAEAEQLARRVLEDSPAALEDVAGALLEREVLSADELEALVERGSAPRPASAGSTGG